MEIGAIVWDVKDVPRAVAFWSAALDYRLRDPATDDRAILIPRNGTGVRMTIAKISSEEAMSSRMDLFTLRQAADVERLLALGATRADWRCPPGADCVALEDPDGNPFRVVRRMKAFLEASEFVDCANPAVVKKADELSRGLSTDAEKVCAAYRFVRDRIRHPFDIKAMAGLPHASEVLGRGIGICHAKSNLLAALLRAMGIPAGFRYQHLTLLDDDSKGYCLHCYNVVFLNGKWIELDARGNKEGVNARFSMGEPVLAFPNRPEYDEYFFEGIYAAPDAPTMALLCRAKTPAEVLENLTEFPAGKPNIPFGWPREMSFPEMKEKWLKTFAAGVPEEELRAHVTAERCYLWHIFSYEMVACEEGDAARETFDTLSRDACYLFEEGHWGDPPYVKVRPKPTATEMDREADLYAVAPDFSWTYVRTHEDWFGPYFLGRRDVGK